MRAILDQESGDLDSSPNSATSSAWDPRKPETLQGPFQPRNLGVMGALARKPGSLAPQAALCYSSLPDCCPQ